MIFKLLKWKWFFNFHARNKEMFCTLQRFETESFLKLGMAYSKYAQTLPLAKPEAFLIFSFLSFFFFLESCKFATVLKRNRGPWKFVSLQIPVNVVVVVVVVVVIFLKTSIQIEDSLLLQVDPYRFSRLSWELNESPKITMTKKRNKNAV